MTTHINIYSEVEATVTSLESKVREEMREEDLVLVMANGLRYYDQEGTRGNSVIYKLILKCCECFRKLTTRKKHSCFYCFLVWYFHIFCFACSFFFFFCRIARAMFNTKLDENIVLPVECNFRC